MMDLLHDMSKVMQRWMSEMSDPGGLSPADGQRMAGAMRTMSGVMQDMSVMMERSTLDRMDDNDMMTGGPGMTQSGQDMMYGVRHGVMGEKGDSMTEGDDQAMMTNPRMMERMQRMQDQMQKLLANEEH
jgi:hypothetical protein